MNLSMLRFKTVALALASLMASVSCVGDTQTPAFMASMDAVPPNDDPVNDDPTDDRGSASDLVAKIRTEVDPAFEYEYEQTKFVPPAGKTLLVLGQTL